MAKYYDVVGYVNMVETAPGVWVDGDITEGKYAGDILSNYKKTENAEQMTDNVNVNNKISIVADAYAMKNFFAIRYARWMGVYWKVTSVEPVGPRLILTLGGVYSGKQREST